MGAHALKYAIMVYSRLAKQRMFRFFDTAILAAADTERDALERFDKMGPLAYLAKSVHCYINDADKTLELGDEFIDPPDRLGSYGPRSPLELTKNFGAPLSIIDCRKVDYPWRDMTRHQYHRISPQVITDIQEAIEGRQGDEFTYRKSDKIRGIHRLTKQQKSRSDLPS